MAFDRHPALSIPDSSGMFIAALAVPGVFKDDGVLFGGAFLVVCLLHAVLRVARAESRALIASL